MTSETLQTQAIIVGAGPAGAATSFFLAKAGISHVIIDKATFPRDKVCGDACSGKTAFVLRRANPALLGEIFENTHQFNPCSGFLFTAPNGSAFQVPFPTQVKGEPAEGFVAPRLTFDHFLFSKLDPAYASVYQNASVLDVERSEGKITLRFTKEKKTFTVTAPLIVGADGEKSQVRKILMNDNRSEKASSVALRGYYKGVTGLHQENYIELHFLPEVRPGYFWIFPLPGGLANVGVGLFSQRKQHRQVNLRALMLHVIQHHPAIKHRFEKATLVSKIQGWGLPIHRKRQNISGDHFLLTGDAACLVNPFSGEGIGNALASGMHAALAIEKALAADKYDAAFLRQCYDDALFRLIGDELKVSAMFQRICHYPWLFNLLATRVRRNPSLGKTVHRMLTDLDLRKQLQKPSFYIKFLFSRQLKAET
ncbi:MAG: geranylgeranyl reductase family protein [Flavisolibacter sp.]|nr:geranylgeranyl reductase family protein [Flavisolibacter sp.]